MSGLRYVIPQIPIVLEALPTLRAVEVVLTERHRGAKLRGRKGSANLLVGIDCVERLSVIARWLANCGGTDAFPCQILLNPSVGVAYLSGDSLRVPLPLDLAST